MCSSLLPVRWSTMYTRYPNKEITSWTAKKMDNMSRVTKKRNLSVLHSLSAGMWTLIWYGVLQVVQWQNAKPSLIERQLSRHSRWTYFWEPLHLHGAIKSLPSDSRQIRHWGCSSVPASRSTSSLSMIRGWRSIVSMHAADSDALGVSIAPFSISSTATLLY